MHTPKSLLGHLAASFTIFTWGVTFASTKVLMADFSPVEIIFFRLALALVALSIAAPKRWGWGGWKQEWKLIGAGLCGVTLYFLCQNIALSYTLAANVSVLVSVAPLFTALACRVFLNEKLKPRFFLGFAVAIGGILLIAFNGSLVLKLNPLGDLLSILAALAWAFYNVLMKKSGTAPEAVIATTRKVFSYGLLFLLPALPFFNFRLGFERLGELSNLLNLLFLGVVASAVCFVTWNVAVHHLGPVRTSVYIYLIPVITILASLLVLKEPLTLASGAGAGLILAGMALSEGRG